jgi:hypothetical protein
MTGLQQTRNKPTRHREIRHIPAVIFMDRTQRKLLPGKCFRQHPDTLTHRRLQAGFIPLQGHDLPLQPGNDISFGNHKPKLGKTKLISN